MEENFDATPCPVMAGRFCRSEKMALGDEGQNGDENQQKRNLSGTDWLQLGDVVLTGYEVGQNSTII